MKPRERKTAVIEEISTRWVMQPLPADVSTRQNLPSAIPVPPRETQRVAAGKVRLEEVVSWIDKYLEENPEEQSAESLRFASRKLTLFGAALTAWQKKEFDAAEDLYTQAHNLDPADAVAVLNLAFVARDKANPQRALQLLQSVDRALAGYAPYHLCLGQVLSQLGQRPEAVQHLKMALEGDPQNRLIIQELVNLGELIPIPPDPNKPNEQRLMPRADYEKNLVENLAKTDIQPGRLFQQAIHELNQRRPQFALLIARRLSELNPQDKNAYNLATVCFEQLGDVKSAEEHSRKALEVDPTDLDGRYNIAVLGRKTGRPEADIDSELMGILASEPNYFKAWQALLDPIKDNEGRLAKAREIASKVRDGWAPAHVLANLYAATEQPQEALEHSRLAWQRNQAPALLQGYMTELLKTGSPEECAGLIDSLTQLHRLPPGLRWNAMCLMSKIDRDRSMMELADGLVKDPQSTDQLRQMANAVLAEMRKGRKVKITLDKAPQAPAGAEVLPVGGDGGAGSI